MERSLDSLQVGLDLGLRLHVLRLCRHVDVGLVTELVDRGRCSFGCLKFWGMRCELEEP